MRHLKTYKLFESLNLIESFVSDYLKDCKWNIKNSLGNCAFFAKDFYDWCQSKKIECRLIYLKQDENFSKSGDIEDHIVVAIDDYIIDFVYTQKGVSKKIREENFLEALKRQMSPEITLVSEFKEKYQKWGYNDIEEISYSEAYEGHMARCQTIDYPKRLNESIKVPIKVGDTVLGGRFKNKKMVVKKIGKNKKGDITINDKPLLKFRLVKENFEKFEDDIKDILIDLEDNGLQVTYSRMRKDVEVDPERFINNIRTDMYLEVYITRPYGSEDRVIPGLQFIMKNWSPGGKHPGNLIFWFEIKDYVTRITEWYYLQTTLRWEKSESPLRFFASGVEMFSGFNKAEDFSEVGDLITFTNFRMEIRL